MVIYTRNGHVIPDCSKLSDDEIYHAMMEVSRPLCLLSQREIDLRAALEQEAERRSIALPQT